MFERVGRRRSDTHGEIQDVEDDESQQHNAGDNHGAGSKGVQATHEVGAADLTAGLVCTPGDGERAVDVQDQGSKKGDAEDPQHALVRNEGVTDLAQEFAVLVDRVVAVMHGHEDLQVTDHVDQHEPTKNQASDGHGELQCPGRELGPLAERFFSNFAVSDCVTVVIFNSHGTSSVAFTVRLFQVIKPPVTRPRVTSHKTPLYR